MPLQLLLVPPHIAPLLPAPILQCFCEIRISHPVPAAHPRRQEPARQLVLALCTRLETGQPFAQAVFDALVVAGFEVQAGQGGAAPVAALQRVATAQAQRPGNRLAVQFGQEQHQPATQ